MCGIAGILKRNGSAVDPSKAAILESSLIHRGPDGKGTWYSRGDSIALIHRRLAIIDLSERGNQPMHSADKKLTIVYNGEIYNYIELRQTLKQNGWKFHTDSDTEVILNAYRQWGPAMQDYMNGMWAFAIWDDESRQMFLSRDRYGVKPLYYYQDESEFVFASEIKSIHRYLGGKAVADEVVLADIAKASFNYHGTERTYLRHVKSLPGGHYMTVSAGKIETDKWYQLRQADVPEGIHDQAAAFRSLLIDSCKIRLRSDVKIATCLSGGLDSGSITAIINSENVSGPGEGFDSYSHTSFLASFPGTFLDERKEAEVLAGQLGNRLEVIDILDPDIQQLEEAMASCDGPMHALAFYPIYKLYKHINKQGIKVTIDGQGPDEMLGGYRPLKPALYAALQAKNFRWAADVIRTYASMGESDQFSSRKFAYQAVIKVCKEMVHSALHGEKILEEKTSYHKELQPLLNRKLFKNILDNHFYHQFFYSPLPAILNQFDRCSMASGVECRMPFMDYRIVEFIFSLPTTSKVGHGYTKRILREAMKGILPDSTRLNKKKIGFNAPMVEWFTGPLKPFILDIMNSDSYLQSPYFDGKKLKRNFEIFLTNPVKNFEIAFGFWPSVHISWWHMKYMHHKEM